jgi:hypothetical protein
LIQCHKVAHDDETVAELMADTKASHTTVNIGPVALTWSSGGLARITSANALPWIPIALDTLQPLSAFFV